MLKTLNLLRKISLVSSYFIFISSCSLKPVITTHGILNLDKRTDLIFLGSMNKNDVIKILGETTLKEQPDEKKWVYIETVEQKKFGKKKIIKNTMLILEFDNRGLLKNKEVLSDNDFNEIKFDKNVTVTSGVNDSLSKRIFSSIRKRAQNRMDTLTK
jgi:outer membrane protein assembly factor BamE (lipoprotein component of BamABCDE complex)|tara:strand:+ start:173 stop:643 length:471 start_codon:yes stop_codon:yes gene_type:complete